MSKPRYPFEMRRRFWRAVRAGVGVNEAARLAGGSPRWAWGVFREAGGVNPVPIEEPVGRYLSFDERVRIGGLRAAGLGVRAIARELGRDPGTVSPELRRGAGTRGYKATVAQAAVDRGRRSPRAAKLATNLALRREVQARGSSAATAPSRSLADSGSTSPTIRRCGCRPRRSISRCTCRPAAD
jgi:IS30 family transposase